MQSFSLNNNSELRISESQIEFENSWGKITSVAPIAIRYGTIPIDIYKFRIGYKYLIQILTESNKTISIPIKNYFGIGRNKPYNKYNTIIKSLFSSHFDNLFQELINKYNDGNGLVFDEKYSINDSGLHIGSKNKFIPFNEMEIEERFDHFVVNSTLNPKLFTNIYYLNTWNSTMIYSLLELILNEISPPHTFKHL